MSFDFNFTDEHDELRSTVRAFLSEKSDEQAVREQMASERGHDPAVWKQMAEELGLAGLIIPEQYGGAGFGFVELLIVMEEMGRSLLCSPYLGTSVFAASALQGCADDAQKEELLTAIAAGTTLVSVAHAEPGGRWDLESI
jgi:alkylation response protein AidB-like acyl-CoA dehydrogenase